MSAPGAVVRLLLNGPLRLLGVALVPARTGAPTDLPDWAREELVRLRLENLALREAAIGPKCPPRKDPPFGGCDEAGSGRS